MTNRRGEHLRNKINDAINQLAEKEYGMKFFAREEQIISHQKEQPLKENSGYLRRNTQERQERQLESEKLLSRQQLERAIEAHQRFRAFQRERTRP